MITGAAADNPKVKALVYLAAFAPDGGEPVGAFGDKYPNDLGKAFHAGLGGFPDDRPEPVPQPVRRRPAGRRFAPLPRRPQKPVSATVFGASVPKAAWKTIPSWYVVSKQDHAIQP